MSNPTPIGQPLLWIRQNRPGEFYDLRGSNGDDRIDILNKVGTNNEDFSGDGEHHAYGYGGNDVIRGDLYAVNCLFGGAGSDTITGGNKVDILFGNRDNDVLLGMGGRDLLRGGSGNDMLFGGRGADSIYGGAGDDFIVGGAAGDMIDGGEGIDTVSFAVHEEDPSTQRIMAGVEVDLSGEKATSGTIGGTGQTATEFGSAAGRGAYEKFIKESPPNQNGHAGDDLFNIENVIGTSFRDILTGDANDNVLEGGAGDDDLSGGEGSDTASYKSSERFVVVFLSTDRSIFQNTNLGGRFQILQSGLPAAGDPLILTADEDGQTRNVGISNEDGGIKITESGLLSYSDAHGDKLKGIENLEGSDHDDVLGGDAGNNTLDGGAGDDYLYGGAGDDELQGGAGADRLYGGDSSILGGDWAVYASAVQSVVVDLGNPAGNLGDAFGDTYDSIENIGGSDHDDRLTGDGNSNEIDGNAGVDVIRGGDGADFIDGGEGDDFLYGEAGIDVINGGEGNDRLYGGASSEGVDNLLGGAGNDGYYFDVGGSHSIINDNEGANTIYFTSISSGIVGDDIDFEKNSQSRDLEIRVPDPDASGLLYRVTIKNYFEELASTTGIGFSIYYGTEANPGANLIDIPELA